jgi:hypothetical protein
MSTGLDDIPAARLRVMQIIAAALMIGVLTFLGIALFLVYGQRNGQGLGQANDLPIVSLLAIAMFAINTPLAFFLPNQLARPALKQIAAAPENEREYDIDKLLGVRQATLIVGLALIEGTAFCACIGFLLDADVGSLVVVGLCLLLMLALFPTRNRVRNWLDRQAMAVQDLRNAAGN